MVAAGDCDVATLDRALTELGLRPNALDAAEAAGLVRRAVAGYAFRHPVLRAVVYRDADPGERRDAHRALARSVTVGDPRAAWHLAAAAAGPDESVAAALERAADDLAPRASFAEASLAYARAADLSPNHERRVSRLIRAAQAAVLAGRVDAATTFGARARDEACNAMQRAQAQQVLGQVWTGWSTLPIAEHAALLELEAERVADAHGDQASAMLVDAAFAANAIGDLGRSARLAARAAALAARSGDEARVQETGMIVAYTRLETLADVIDMESLQSLIADLDGTHLRATQYGTLIDRALVHLDRHEQFAATISQRVADARAAAAIFPLAILLVVRSEGEFQTGRWRLADADVAEALALVPATSLLSAYLHAYSARNDGVRGRTATCRVEIERALAVAKPADAAGILHVTAAATAEDALAHGDFGTARAHFEHLADLQRDAAVGNPVFLNWQPGLLECCVKLGDRTAAERVAGELQLAAERLPTPTLLAYAAEAQARLAVGAGFEPLFEEALEHHAAGGRRFMRARTHLAYGERLRRERRRRKAREQLRKAIAIFDELLAEPWAERARRELRATGETVSRRTEDVRDRLTAHELQVARLARHGHSNRDIAVSLFISPKTVEKHITSIYRKLGIASRHELWELWR